MNYPEFCGSSYISQSRTADDERTVNWFFERMESQGATSRSALYPTPGVRKIAASAYGPGRAHFYQSGREFGIFGPKFHEISEFGVLTFRGDVAIGDNPATISSNGDGGGQLFITSGDNGYIYDLQTHAFTQVAALDGKATMGDSLGAYFLALDAKTSTLYVSDLLDGLTWDPTMFAQRTIAPDPWRSMKVNGRYIWLFGELTSEVWYDAGASNFPFAPHPSGLVSYGIAAPFSVALAEGQIIWLGASKTGDAYVLRAAGFTPEVVSDYPLQYAFNNYVAIEDALGDTYSDAGHTFYLLTFPRQDVTWAWDVQLGRWAERGTWLAEQNRYQAWRPQWHAMAFGEHRMLDSETGSIYLMSSAILALDVDGRPMRRLRRAPDLNSELQNIFYSSLEIDLEPGLGLMPYDTSDLPNPDLTLAEGESLGLEPGVDFAVTPTFPRQGWNPQIFLRFSNDGGRTWSTEMMRGAGKSGEWSTRVRWTRLGMGRRRVFEVVCTDPIPFRLTACYLELAQPVKGQQQQARTA